MSYMLQRTCQGCGHSFKVELEPGEVWPNRCDVCTHVDNETVSPSGYIEEVPNLGLQKGPQ